MKLYTRTDIKMSEVAALKLGYSPVQYAEKCGQQMAAAISELYNDLDGPIAILCGGGASTAKACAMARQMKLDGKRVFIVLCFGAPESSTADQMYSKAINDGIPAGDLVTEHDIVIKMVKASCLVVDAIFGTAYNGGMDSLVEGLISTANSLTSAHRVAVELPSGLYADSGFADDTVFHADMTFAFTGFTPAHIMQSGKKYCGELCLLDGGLPEETLSDKLCRTFVIDEEMARSIAVPKDPLAHKGTVGKLTLIAGCPKFRGAAVIAAKGAYNAGAGLVSLCSDEKVNAAVAVAVPEAVFYEEDDAKKLLTTCSAAVVGCGMDIDEEARERTAKAIRYTTAPLVIDGGGLSSIASTPEILSSRPGATVLTPHPGEFARLTDCTISQVLKNRVKFAREYSENHPSVLVLKSENTVIAYGGKVFINVIGNEGLGKAGSGDLLAGIIGALLARKMNPLDAAILGVWIHSRAADIAVKTIDPYSLNATKTADFISNVYRELFRKDPEANK